MHRLDRDTSGLMVFARTPDAQKHLEQQFRKHTTGSAYLAIVHGDIKEQTIESRFVARPRRRHPRQHFFAQYGQTI